MHDYNMCIMHDYDCGLVLCYYSCLLSSLGHIEVVHTLLNAGAIVSTTNNAGKSAAQLGALTGNGKYDEKLYYASFVNT